MWICMLAMADLLTDWLTDNPPWHIAAYWAAFFAAKKNLHYRKTTGMMFDIRWQDTTKDVLEIGQIMSNVFIWISNGMRHLENLAVERENWREFTAQQDFRILLTNVLSWYPVHQHLPMMEPYLLAIQLTKSCLDQKGLSSLRALKTILHTYHCQHHFGLESGMMLITMSTVHRWNGQLMVRLHLETVS